MGLARKVLVAALWSFLSKAGAKLAAREDLKDDTAHEVVLRITGTIDGSEVDESIAGKLSIAGAKVSADNQHLSADQAIAWLLQHVGSEMATKIEERLCDEAKKLEARARRKNKTLKEGEPPRTLHLEVAEATDKKWSDAAKRILARYKLSGTKTSNGAVSYIPAAAE